MELVILITAIAMLTIICGFVALVASLNLGVFPVPEGDQFVRRFYWRKRKTIEVTSRMIFTGLSGKEQTAPALPRSLLQPESKNVPTTARPQMERERENTTLGLLAPASVGGSSQWNLPQLR